jgi:1-acyl-sn-glycerol-3-phosphate acyltransferase
VQPVALRYRDPSGARCQAVPFVGDDTFVASLLRIAAAPSVHLELTWLPALLGEDRRALAEHSRALARSMLDRRGEIDPPRADEAPLAA